jgi:hypothetical protein
MEPRSPRSVAWRDLPVWLRVLCVIAILNFASFWIIAVVSGGDALNGKAEGGHYFLMSHGRYTEVSKAFFDYSAIHATSVWITHPAVIFGGTWFYLRRKATRS